MVSTGSSPASVPDREPARRRLPASERRVLILDAALRTFAANGYEGAAMDEIAAAAGVSKAVVYDHVASKRDLYTQLLHVISDQIQRTVEEALRPPGVDGEQRVHAAAKAIYRYVEEHPEASRLLVLELQGANVSSIGRELEHRMSVAVATTLGTDRRLFDDHPNRELQLTILAELLKSAVLGLAAWWYRHSEAARDDLVERTVALVWPAIERARAHDAASA
jgi:AcrR family transcriptional regulator